MKSLDKFKKALKRIGRKGLFGRWVKLGAAITLAAIISFVRISPAYSASPNTRTQVQVIEQKADSLAKERKTDKIEYAELVKIFESDFNKLVKFALQIGRAHV